MEETIVSDRFLKDAIFRFSQKFHEDVAFETGT